MNIYGKEFKFGIISVSIWLVVITLILTSCTSTGSKKVTKTNFEGKGLNGK